MKKNRDFLAQVEVHKDKPIMLRGGDKTWEEIIITYIIKGNRKKSKRKEILRIKKSNQNSSESESIY